MVRRLQRKKSKGKQAQARRKMQFEALEPRILLSADLGFDQLNPHVDPLLASEPAAEVGELLQDDLQLQPGGAPPEQSPVIEPARELVIVDPTVADYQAIIDQITDTDATDYQVEVLASDQDGLQQIGQLLAEQNELSAIHIISHGSSGQLLLGGSSLDNQSLTENADLLQQWGEALAEEGDILLYGCSVAEGEAGIEFVQSLAKLTDADVAASIDTTGASALGGDWELEAIDGDVGTQAVEVAEYKLLLATDLFSEEKGALKAGLSAFEEVFAEFIESDGSLNKQLPLLIKVEQNRSSSASTALSLNDLFEFNVSNKSSPVLHDLLFKHLTAAVDSSDLVDYLDDESFTDPQYPGTTVEFGSVSKSSGKILSYTVPITLKVIKYRTLDLGTQADSLGITLSNNPDADVQIEVESELNMTLEFGVLTSGEAAEADDFFITLSNATFTAKPTDNVNNVRTKIGSSESPGFPASSTNIGFIGTSISDGSIKFNASVDFAMTNLTSADRIGFVGESLSSNKGTLTASPAASNLKTGDKISFFLRAGQSDSQEVRFTVSGNGLQADIENALVDKGLGGLYTVYIDSNDIISITLADSAQDLLGFSSATPLYDESGVLVAGQPFDLKSSKTFSLLLSSGRSVPKVVQVTTTPEGDTGAELTLDGLLEDINLALSAAGFTDVTAEKVNIGTATDESWVVKLATSDGSTLEIPTEFTLVSRVTHSDLVDSEISANELFDSTHKDYEEATDTSNGVNAYRYTLSADAAPGLTVINNTGGSWTGKATIESTSEQSHYLVDDPIADQYGNTRFALSVDGDNFAPFTRIQAADVINQLRNFGSWLDSLKASDYFSADKIPFANATFGDIFDFQDMLEDLLLTDDLDNTDESDDIYKLIGKDDSPNHVNFSNVQMFAEELTKIASDSAGLVKNPNVRYDVGNEILLSDLDLSYGFNSINVPVDFSFDLLPFQDFRSDSLVQLTGKTGLNVTLGIDLTEGAKLQGGTELSELNYGKGVDFQHSTQVVTTGAVTLTDGRLTADAQFDLHFGGQNYTVLLEQTAKDSYQSVGDLALDLTKAVREATGGKIGAKLNYADNQCIDVYTLDSDVSNFSVNASGVAVSELGFAQEETISAKKDVSFITTGEVEKIYGRLNGDANFEIAYFESTQEQRRTVTLAKEATQDNTTIENLITDLQGAISTQTDKIGVRASITDPQRIEFYALSGEISQVTIEADSSDPAVRELGFEPSIKASPTLTTTKDANHVLAGDSVFRISYQSTTDTITFSKPTTDYTSLKELVSALDAAIQEETSNKFGACIDTANGQRIVVYSLDADIQDFSLTAEPGSAVKDLGFSQSITVADRNTLTAQKDLQPLVGTFDSLETAIFDLSFGGETYRVELPSSATYDNSSVADLVADLDKAVKTATEEKIGVRVNSDNSSRFDIYSLASESANFTLNVPDSGNPAVTVFGLRTVSTTGLVTSTDNLPSNGKFDEFACSFKIALTDPAQLQDSDYISISLSKAETEANKNIFDLVDDVQQALNRAGLIAITVANQGNRLVFKAISDDSRFAIKHDPSGNSGLVGLNGALISNSDDLIVHFRDGTNESISLSDLTANSTIDQLKDKFSIQGKLTAEISEDGKRLLLKEGTDVSGSQTFYVESVNGSKAIVQLGLLRSDIKRAGDTADGVIDGATIFGTRPEDRFFVNNNSADSSVSGTFELQTLYSVTAEDTVSKDGKLASDAVFTVSLEDTPKTVTVLKTDTDGNTSRLDLVEDINNALEAALLTNVSVTLSGEKLCFSSTNSTIAIGSYDELGFKSARSADAFATASYGKPGYVVEINNPALSDGKINTDAVFEVLLSGSSTVVSLAKTATSDNASLNDLATDLDAVLNNVQVRHVDGKIFLYSADPTFSIRTAEKLSDGTTDNAAVAEFGFSLEEKSTPWGEGGTGFVDVDLLGGGTIGGSFTSPFVFDSSNKISFSKLFDNLRPPDTDHPEEPQLNKVITRPSETITDNTLTFAVDVEPDVSFLPGPDGTVTMTVTNLWDRAVTVAATNLSENLKKFDKLTGQDVEYALEEVAAFVADFETSGNLDKPLALINQSVHDLLGLSEKLDQAVEAFRDNPATSLQSLSSVLKEVFGGVATLSLDDNRLKINLKVSNAINESVNLDIALEGDNPRLVGPADLKAKGSLMLTLDFGIDLDNPADVYLYDTTNISGNLSVTGSDLSFWASLEPDEGDNLSVYVNQGAASFKFGDFSDPDDPENVVLASLSFSSPALIGSLRGVDGSISGVTSLVNGTTEATLPSFAPKQTDFAGDIVLSGGDISGDLTDLTRFSLAGAAEILDSVDPAEQQPYNNLLMAVEGLDLFFGGLQDLLDGEVFGINIPIIGDQFSDAARFIEDLRDDFIDPFRSKVEEVVDPNADLLSNLLFQLLGAEEFGAGSLFPGVALDLLLTADENDPEKFVRAETAEDIELEIGDEGEYIQWNLKIGKESERLVGTDIDLDLGIPGLGIDVEGDIGLDLGWNLDLKFGVSNEDGFYLDISDPSDLRVDLDVELPTNITGKLGFLQLEAVDNPFIITTGDLGFAETGDWIVRSESNSVLPENGQLSDGVEIIVELQESSADTVIETITLAVSETSDNESLSDLVDDLNSIIEKTALLGLMEVTEEAGKLILSSIPSSGLGATFAVDLVSRMALMAEGGEAFQLTKISTTGGKSELGFNVTPDSETVIIAESEAPVKGQLQNNVGFDLLIDGETKAVALLKSATSDNDSIDDLVADINESLVAAKIGDRIIAGKDGKRLTLKSLPAIKSFTVENTAEDKGGFAVLFNSQADSAGKSFLYLNKNIPDNGQLDDDLGFKVTVTEGSNKGKTYEVFLASDETVENESTTDLIKQLNEVLKEKNLNKLMSFGSGDPRMTLGDLSSLGVNFGLAAEAIADLDLTLSANSDLIGGTTGVIPELNANFLLEWGFGDRSEGDDQDYVDISVSELKEAVGEGLQLVEFKDVSLDLGSFITDFIDPVLGEIKKITEPVQPVVDILTMEIPVISDLSGSPVTLLDIADLFGDVRPDFIRGVANVISLINSIPTDAESIQLGFGDFEIYNADNEGQPDLTDEDLQLDTSSTAGNQRDEIDSNSRSGSFTKTISKSEGFVFPILTDPQEVFNLLLGQEATLMTYDLPELYLDFSYSQYFPIFGPLGASITGSFSADIDFHEIGFDTSGISLFADSGFRNPELIFEGFYIYDLDDSGNDVPEVVLSGGLSAAAELNLGVASAGAAGGIFADIYFDMFDPNRDGKIRINEILSTIDSQVRFGNAALAPLSVFDVSGEVYAKLFAFLEIDLFFFSFSDSWNITPPITLVEFDIPFTRPPQLATELEGGVLQLNMGEFAEQRLHGNISDGDEAFTVSGDANSLTVEAFGYKQTYAPRKASAFSKILASAGEGSDTVDLAGVTDASVASDILGGAGIDTLTAGAGIAVIRGDDGDDEIHGGSNNDQLFGGVGNDIISGGGGADLIVGDDARIGDDYIRARATLTDGDDKLFSGAITKDSVDPKKWIMSTTDIEGDIIIGGGGVDTVEGGSGVDVIIGDSGRIAFSAPERIVSNIKESNNTLKVDDTDRGLVFAGDTLKGGAGNDTIYGGQGDDLISGEGGNDTLFGESGDDTLLCADITYSKTEREVVRGGDGNDLILGDRDDLTGPVTTTANAGPIEGALLPLILGDKGDDIIIGRSIADDIDGGRGQDIVFAGGGADTIRGGQGSDLLNGEAGGDAYEITYTGGIISSTTTVYDSGNGAGDVLTVTGSAENDQFLLRASSEVDGELGSLQSALDTKQTGANQILEELNSSASDLSLSLGLSGDLKRAFVAKLNDNKYAERANYYNVETVNVNTLAGDDQVAVDDAAAIVQINGGEGDDLFQVGQLYNSPRDEAAGIDQYDVFDTVQTTKGFLSNGISYGPMLINGEAGEDSFVVFRNLQALSLDGGDDDDEFLVKAFALEGSVDDPNRDRTDITGAGGADLIKYAVNAPVGINGGDGLDTVIALGTEFGDDFVVTANGVYGAGLNVNFVGVEVLKLDTAEGNDRIFVLSTGSDHVTEITAGEGSDTFFIGGDTPPVVSNDLLGHSGLINHEIISSGADYAGASIDGISANVGDNDEPFIRVIKNDGSLRVLEDAGLADSLAVASYGLVLTRQPVGIVRVIAKPQTTSPSEDSKGIEYIVIGGDGTPQDDGSMVLSFDAENWFIPQAVTVEAETDTALEGVHFATINHLVQGDDAEKAAESSYDLHAIPSVNVEILDDDLPGLIIEQTEGVSRVSEGSDFGAEEPFADSYTIRLNQKPTSDVIVTFRNPDGQLEVDQTQLTFTTQDWDDAQTVRVKAVDDAANEGFHFGYLVNLVNEVEAETVAVEIGDNEKPGVWVLQSGGSTDVEERKLNLVTQPVGSQELTVVGDFSAADYSGSFIAIVNGTGAGQVRTITENTNVSARINETWQTTPDATSRFVLFETYQPVGSQELTVIGDFSAANYSGSRIAIVNGTGAGQVRTITENTDVSARINKAWQTTPDATSRYLLLQPNDFHEVTSGTDDRIEAEFDFTGYEGSDIIVVDESGLYQLRTVIDGSDGGAQVDRAWDARLGEGKQFFLWDDLDEHLLEHQQDSALLLFGDFSAKDYSGSVVKIVAGTGAGQERTMVKHTDRSAQLDTPWDTGPDASSRYVLFETYQLALTAVPDSAVPDSAVTVKATAEQTKTSYRPTFLFSADGGSAAVTELGFMAENDATYSLSSGQPAPANGQLSSDLTFQIDLTPDDDSDNSITVTLTAAETADYQSIDDLVVGLHGKGEKGSADRVDGAIVNAGLTDMSAKRDGQRIVIYRDQPKQQEQVSLDSSSLTFDATNWNQPQTVLVEAIDDAIVDGGYSKSFARVEQIVARIQGPLILNGAGGEGSNAGLGADPFMLPGETNDVGNISAVPNDSQVELKSADLEKLGPVYFKALDSFEPGDENDELKAKVIIAITSGPGAGQERVVVKKEGSLLTLAEAWDEDDQPNSESRYKFIRQIAKVNEAEQVDIAVVENSESLADNLGDRRGILGVTTIGEDEYNLLSGLGMGPDLTLRDEPFDGGIAYTDLENLTINLGSGQDELLITDIQHRDDFQTVTVINTGEGDDRVHFSNLQAEGSGLLALHLEQGNDTVTAENTTASVVIFGDDGLDTIQSGDGDDIIFADFGRVDYLNTSGELVTRFGLGQRGDVQDTVAKGPIAADDFDSYPFAQTDGGFHGPKVAVSRLDTIGWDDELDGGGGDDLLVGGFGVDTMRGGSGNDAMIGDNGRAIFSAWKLAEVASGDPELGGEDNISGGPGDDLLIGGARADRLFGNAGNDYIVGDAGRATYARGVLQTVETIDEHRFKGGDDWLDGGPDNDAMFGGHGSDTFVGDLKEDLMIGEYARLILKDGKAESVVRLGQGRLDLLANRQFGLYNPLALIPSISELNPVQQPSRAQQLIEEQRPDDSDEKERVSHSSSSPRVQDGGLGYGSGEGEPDPPPADEELLAPQEEEQPVEDVAEPEADEVKTAPEKQEDHSPEGDEEKTDEELLPEEEQDITLKAAVAGLTGWGVASTKRQRTKDDKRAFHLEPLRQQHEWRWESGRLSKVGWNRAAQKEELSFTGTGAPLVKSEIRRNKHV